MSAFSNSEVVIHQTGRSASGVVLVGSQFRVPLQYADNQGQPTELTGYTLDVKAEVQTGEFTGDGLLRVLQGAPTAITNPPAVSLNSADPTQFILTIAHDLLPQSMRAIAVDAELLPTVLIYVRITAPSPSQLIDQVRLALGFRRGYGSLA